MYFCIDFYTLFECFFHEKIFKNYTLNFYSFFTQNRVLTFERNGVLTFVGIITGINILKNKRIENKNDKIKNKKNEIDLLTPKGWHVCRKGSTRCDYSTPAGVVTIP